MIHRVISAVLCNMNAVLPRYVNLIRKSQVFSWRSKVIILQCVNLFPLWPLALSNISHNFFSNQTLQSTYRVHLHIPSSYIIIFYITRKNIHITRFLKMVLPNRKACCFQIETFSNYQLAWHTKIDFYFHMIYGKSKYQFLSSTLRNM